MARAITVIPATKDKFTALPTASIANRRVAAYEKAVDRLNKSTAERESRRQCDRGLRIFISSIKQQPLALETRDEGLWLTLLETATVHADNRITFCFKEGTGIEVGAE